MGPFSSCNLDRLFQGFPAGVVFAVCHDEQDLLLQLAVLFQLFGRGHDRIVERGSAASLVFLQGCLQQVDLVGKGLVEKILVAEIDDEYFIVGIAGADQIDGGLDYLGALFSHRA